MPNGEQKRQWLSIEEAAARLELHPKTVRTYIKDKKLRATKVGNKWRITEAAIQEYLDRGSNIVEVPAA